MIREAVRVADPISQLAKASDSRSQMELTAAIINNALISNTIGVSVTASNYLWDYNAQWHNTLNYAGVFTGPHDVRRDPLVVDPATGDFHLRFSSPLIDAGFNLGALNTTSRATPVSPMAITTDCFALTSAHMSINPCRSMPSFFRSSAGRSRKHQAYFSIDARVRVMLIARSPSPSHSMLNDLRLTTPPIHPASRAGRSGSDRAGGV